MSPTTPRPITATDLRWYFTESESLLGLRSALGTMFERRQLPSGDVESFFCPMPRGSGAPDGEAALVRATRLRHEGGFDAIAVHRRIHHALRDAPSEHIAVLRAAYGPDDWTRQLPRDVAAPVTRLLRELVNVAPLTAAARAAAARRMGPSDAPCASPEEAQGRAIVTADDTGDVRCAYKPTKTPRRPKDRPSQKGKAPPATPAEAASALFRADPALAASPRGAVIAVACSSDDARRQGLRREAEALLRAAHDALGVVVVEPTRPRRTRGTTKPGYERLRPTLRSEAHGG